MLRQPRSGPALTPSDRADAARVTFTDAAATAKLAAEFSGMVLRVERRTDSAARSIIWRTSPTPAQIERVAVLAPGASHAW